MREVNILLLEDSQRDADLLEATLSAEDIPFKLMRVETRDAFVGALESADLDIILSDHALPSFDGKTALDIAREKMPDIPFIFVSGTMGEEVAVESLKGGATDYVLKQRLSRLAPAIRRALAETEERSKRRRAEHALIESEERHRPLFEFNPMPMWVYDLETMKILAVNEAAARRYGYSRDEFLQMTMDDLRPREDIYDLLTDGAMARRKAAVPRVWRHRTKNGAVILVEIWPHTLTFAGRQAQLVLANDVTEQKLLEREREQLLSRLETERALFQSVLSQMPGGVTIAEGESGQLILDNNQSRRILGHDGLPGSELDGYGNYRGFHLDGAAYQPHEWPLMRSVTSGEAVQGEEIDYQRPDGSRVRIVMNSAPITDRSGRIIAAVATFHDVTEQRRVEQLFLQSQKLEAVGRLAGGIAHDFNNLLTIILGYCSLLLELPSDDRKTRSVLETIQAAGERAADLTRQLLAFSRKQVLQLRVISLNDILSKSQKMLGRLVGEDIEVILRSDPELWLVKADPAQMDQVILNLVVNARDAMPRGGKLTIETANVVLDENYCQSHGEVAPGQFVMVAVSDTGVGMDRVTMSYIFEPFFTSKETGKGTGLGLATVLGIVKQSKGSIWVYSEPGKGATFKIYLPRTTEVGREAPPVATRRPLQGNETILLVEDNTMIRMLALDALSRHGYTVIEAAGPEEALVRSDAHEAPIHLVLTDVVMPNASGPEMVQRLIQKRPKLKCLYMSGYTNEALSNHIDLSKDFRFLEKPFTTNELLRLVRETMESS